MSDTDDVFVLASPAPDLLVYPSQVHPDVTDDVTVTAAGSGAATVELDVEAARTLTAAGEGLASVALDVLAARTLDAVGAGSASVSFTVHPYIPPPEHTGGGGNRYPTRLEPSRIERPEDPELVEELLDREDDDVLALLLLGAL